ncbi:MAG: hypothetical protein GEEBNDBF_02588 [bacterium]|nr:hypothetical protein [bacterium]
MRPAFWRMPRPVRCLQDGSDGRTLSRMTTRTSGLRALIALCLTSLLLVAACDGSTPKEEPKAEPPAGGAAQTDPSQVQQPGDPNPTNTPAGQVPAQQPVDTPLATVEVPEGTPMESDQEQALALLNYMERNSDAPRWVITWQGGAASLDLDSVTGILQRRLPDGSTARFEGIDKGTVEEVANGKRGWGG